VVENGVDTSIGGQLYGGPGEKVYDFYFGLGSICGNGIRRMYLV